MPKYLIARFVIVQFSFQKKTNQFKKKKNKVGITWQQSFESVFVESKENPRQ